jgi:hypothetical protein
MPSTTALSVQSNIGEAFAPARILIGEWPTTTMTTSHLASDDAVVWL